jgi:hypothetical protein
MAIPSRFIGFPSQVHAPQAHEPFNHRIKRRVPTPHATVAAQTKLAATQIENELYNLLYISPGRIGIGESYANNQLAATKTLCYSMMMSRAVSTSARGAGRRYFLTSEQVESARDP